MRKVMASQDRLDRQKQTKKYQQSKHLNLYNKISFVHNPSKDAKKYKYSSDSISPLLPFLKLLAKKQSTENPGLRLALNVPDTIVYNDSDLPPFWIYTDPQGFVTRTDGFNGRQILASFMQGANQEEVVAIFKKPHYGLHGVDGNDIRPISGIQLNQMVQSIGSTRGEICALQRFVKANSVKPFIVRTIWRKNSPPECYVITSAYEFNSEETVPEVQKLVTVTRNMKACSIVESKGGGFLKDTLVYINNITKYLQSHLRVGFEEFSADFTKDGGGNWWFLNCKGFVLGNPEAKVDIKHITLFGDYEEIMSRQVRSKTKIEQYQKCKNCRYCNKVFPDHQMRHKLTLLMLLQADRHLLQRGKNYSWLDRCFSQHIGNVNLYIEHKVCDSCYQLYKQIEKLMTLEVEFAKMLGINASETNKIVSITSLPAFKGQSPQFGSRLQKISYSQRMPQHWGLPQGESIHIKNVTSSKSSIGKYRLMVLIHSVRDIPTDLQEGNYYLQYQVFGTVVKYKINLEEATISNNMYAVEVNKIRVFFFFSFDRKDLKQFLQKNQHLKIQLFQDQKFMGEAQFQLDDFKSQKVIKREYYKMCSGKEIQPILSWGLYVTLGICQSGDVDLSNLKLHQHGGIYLHGNPNYYTCDPLPEQWVNTIEEKPDGTRLATGVFGVHKSGYIAEGTISSSSISDDLNHEISNYSRRRVQSSHTKRKVYY